MQNKKEEEKESPWELIDKRSAHELTERLRVPGGWIYSRSVMRKQQIFVSEVFVPDEEEKARRILDTSLVEEKARRILDTSLVEEKARRILDNSPVADLINQIADGRGSKPQPKNALRQIKHELLTEPEDDGPSAA